MKKSLNQIATLIISSFGIALSGFAGCERALVDSCVRSFPEFERTVEVAMVRLKDPAMPSRQIASLIDEQGVSAVSVEDKVLSEDEIEQWQSWSIVRLKELQRSIDMALADPAYAKAYRELSSVANEVVAIYGYAEMGKRKQMLAALHRIRTGMERTQGMVCPK